MPFKDVDYHFHMYFFFYLANCHVITSTEYNGCILKGLTESCKPLPDLEVLQQSLFPTTDLANASGMWKRVELKKQIQQWRTVEVMMKLTQTYQNIETRMLSEKIHLAEKVSYFFSMPFLLTH